MSKRNKPFLNDQKEHVKLYKSGKLWVASLVSVLAACGFVFDNDEGTVHAETTNKIVKLVILMLNKPRRKQQVRFYQLPN